MGTGGEQVVPTNTVYRLALAFFFFLMVTMIGRNRQLHHRTGNVSIRFRSQPGDGWSRGNGVWVEDVFAVRKGFGDRSESFMRVAAVETHIPDENEVKGLGGLKEPIIATITLDDGATIEFAVPRKGEELLLGPFAANGSSPSELNDAERFQTSNAEMVIAAAS